MRNKILTIALMIMASTAMAQVSITVVPYEGSQQQIAIGETGEIFLTADHIIIVPDADGTTTMSFAMDEVRTVKFDGEVRIHDVESQPTIGLYPNPARDRVWVSGIDDTPTTVSIYSMSGALMHRGAYRSHDAIDISGLSKGVYLLRAGRGVAKLIKQ